MGSLFEFKLLSLFDLCRNLLLIFLWVSLGKLVIVFKAATRLNMSNNLPLNISYHW